jgi:hypothetical protein
MDRSPRLVPAWALGGAPRVRVRLAARFANAVFTCVADGPFQPEASARGVANGFIEDRQGNPR